MLKFKVRSTRMPVNVLYFRLSKDFICRSSRSIMRLGLPLTFFGVSILASNCSMMISDLTSGCNDIRQDAWQWGDVRKGTEIQFTKGLSNQVFEFRGFRCYDPYCQSTYGSPSSINKGEIWRVESLKECRNQVTSAYVLELMDETGKLVKIRLSGVNKGDGSPFSKSELARIGIHVRAN